MNPRELLHVLIRVVGVLLIGLGLPKAFDLLGMFIYRLSWNIANPEEAHQPWTHMVDWLTLIQLLGYVFATLFGLYLLFGGKWIMNVAMRGLPEPSKKSADA